ncbi:MAG: hypothetical protein EXR51_11205, partial [Dehalococcoidia bacterium]|nr:hypothetical protein [Dehalococcoidia bacterium]
MTNENSRSLLEVAGDVLRVHFTGDELPQHLKEWYEHITGGFPMQLLGRKERTETSIAALALAYTEVAFGSGAGRWVNLDILDPVIGLEILRAKTQSDYASPAKSLWLLPTIPAHHLSLLEELHDCLVAFPKLVGEVAALTSALDELAVRLFELLVYTEHVPVWYVGEDDPEYFPDESFTDESTPLIDEVAARRYLAQVDATPGLAKFGRPIYLLGCYDASLTVHQYGAAATWLKTLLERDLDDRMLTKFLEIAGVEQLVSPLGGIGDLPGMDIFVNRATDDY